MIFKLFSVSSYCSKRMYLKHWEMPWRETGLPSFQSGEYMTFSMRVRVTLSKYSPISHKVYLRLLPSTFRLITAWAVVPEPPNKSSTSPASSSPTMVWSESCVEKTDLGKPNTFLSPITFFKRLVPCEEESYLGSIQTVFGFRPPLIRSFSWTKLPWESFFNKKSPLAPALNIFSLSDHLHTLLIPDVSIGIIFFASGYDKSKSSCDTSTTHCSSLFQTSIFFGM